MTPNPDPPPAAPLTAEQIAAITRRLNAMGRQGYDVDDALVLLDSHAALRDRLARAEERCVALEGALGDVDEEVATARAFGSNVTLIRDQLYRIEDIVDECLSPTDGAARAGGCPLGGTAGDGGGAT